MAPGEADDERRGWEGIKRRVLDSFVYSDEPMQNLASTHLSLSPRQISILQ
jgi:hypothetical protein